MARTESVEAANLLRKGIGELRRHRPDRALEFLRLAVDAGTPENPEQLSKALYWLSIAFMRMDKRDLAVKSLSSAQKLRQRGRARKFYVRNINQYGMPKRQSPEVDDLYAFVNIQFTRYLQGKRSRTFDSMGERDIVLRIVLGGWKDLKARNIIAMDDCAAKLEIFRSTRLPFPGYSLPARRTGAAKPDFGFPVMADPRGRCVCGSGLPFSQCCGRVRSLREL